jgi:hypothetical protein
MDAQPEAKPAPRPSRLRAAWRKLTTPILAALWIPLFLGCFAIASSVDGSLADLMPIGKSLRHYRVFSVHLYEINGSLVVVSMDSDEDMKLMGEVPPLGHVTYSHVSRVTGLWGPTHSSKMFQLSASKIRADERWDLPESETLARELAFDHLVATGEAGPLPPALRTQDLTIGSIIWGGYVFNLFSLLAFAAMIGCVRRFPETLVPLRERRLRAGLCPRCRYSISGLPTPVCPECGEQLGTNV